MRMRNVFPTILAGTVSAVLFYFGTGLHPNWWLLWFAPVPVIAIASRLGWRASFLLAVIAWFAGALNQWDYFKHEVELPLWLIVVAFLVPAIIFGLGVLRTRAFLRRGWLFAAALYFPAYWVTYEYFTEIASPHSTFGNLGYTQMNCLPLIQITSITGIWGISFTVFLFAATIAALISSAGTPRQRRALAITVGVVLCAIFLFGEWRLNSNPSGQTIAVTLIAKDVPISLYRGSEEQAMALLHDYADEISRVTPLGTDVVVLPEKIARVSEGRLPEVDKLFSARLRWCAFRDCARASPPNAWRSFQFVTVLFPRWKPGGKLR